MMQEKRIGSSSLEFKSNHLTRLLAGPTSLAVESCSRISVNSHQLAEWEALLLVEPFSGFEEAGSRQ